MIKKKAYLLLFFVMVAMASHVIAMDKDNRLFFIENPFDKKQDNNEQQSLQTPIPAGGVNNVFNIKGGVEHQVQEAEPCRHQRIRSHKDVFEKNEEGEFECPYNCPDAYAHELGRCVVQHIKRRHDEEFNLQTFDLQKVDLDTWIPRKRKYADICKQNEKGQYECPYNCPDEYAHKNIRRVVRHIKVRHDQAFDKLTFDVETANLDLYISRKVETGGRKTYNDICEKNGKGEYVCLYNNCNYAKKRGLEIGTHIRRRHDKEFVLKNFDQQTADLDACILKKKEVSRKYDTVFERNENGDFMCPYNCPEGYTHQKGSAVVKHIKRRHDSNFYFQTWNLATADLDEYIERSPCGPQGKYNHVFEQNTGCEYLCPFNNCDYANKRSIELLVHVKKRHDENFDPETFSYQTADLNAYIPKKKCGPKAKKTGNKRKRYNSIEKDLDGKTIKRKRKKRKLVI